MEDLIQIIKWRDEIAEIEYTITRLQLAEQTAVDEEKYEKAQLMLCLLYTSPSPRDGLLSRMPSSA